MDYGMIRFKVGHSMQPVKHLHVWTIPSQFLFHKLMMIIAIVQMEVMNQVCKLMLLFLIISFNLRSYLANPKIWKQKISENILVTDLCPEL